MIDILNYIELFKSILPFLNFILLAILVKNSNWMIKQHPNYKQ
jgi:hypothetical protein